MQISNIASDINHILLLSNITVLADLFIYSEIIMITLLQAGDYELIETKQQTKILILDGKKLFAWIVAEGIGEVLVLSKKSHQVKALLAAGKYRLYRVKDEPELVDLEHLELLVGHGKWQGYLLPTGMPTNKDKRNRIIPTAECITKTMH